VTTRATVALRWACTNACIFCAQKGLDVERGLDPWASALQKARATATEVSFVGGEPSMGTALDDAVATARDLGFEAIGVQTNGSELDPSRLAALAAAGLTDVHVSIHAATPDAHDYHVGQSGRLAHLRMLLEAAADLGLPVVATTVVTRSNLRVLAELPPWLKQRNVAAWVCRWPIVAGRAAESFDRVVPRLGLAVPYTLHALEQARRVELPAAIQGVPTCTLGPHARHRLSSVALEHPSSCDGCHARASCPGIDRAYVDRFTAEELHPRADVEASPTISPAMARMFVGVGPLAPVDATVHDAPARARARLPVLGRPAPASGETRRKSDVKTGDALQGLFPKLFDED
jgi:molybdenum cofactor biosynthesis enzyme MoaA